MNLLAFPPVAQPAIAERHVLGMAEMGYRGLSEQWLLRRAGDIHWRLIAHAMGQKEAVFTCAAGQPLYAAFCATSLQLSAPDLPELGCETTITADLFRVGQGRLGSLQQIEMGGRKIGRIILISAFVGRSDPSSNRSIVQRTPKALALPPEAPFEVRRIAGSAAVIARAAGRGEIDRRRAQEIGTYLPCPSLDFNAAGLLYFPSFSAIAERALFDADRSRKPPVKSRHVVYTGNVEPGEHITVSLKAAGQGSNLFLWGDNSRLLALMRVRYA